MSGCLASKLFGVNCVWCRRYLVVVVLVVVAVVMFRIVAMVMFPVLVTVCNAVF